MLGPSTHFPYWEKLQFLAFQALLLRVQRCRKHLPFCRFESMNLDPIDELERIGHMVCLASYTGLLREFMLRSSRDFKFLPVEATEWLSVAMAYADGDTDAAELESARIAAWQSVAGRDWDTSQPEVAAVRAVICAMFPEFGEDPFETISWFIDFSNRHEDHAKTQAHLLSELFSPHFGG